MPNPPKVQFGYGLNYLIDIENAVIVDVEATPARTYDEVLATRTMIERTERCFALRPKRLAADTAYGTGKFLGWLAGEKITPPIPVWDRSEREDGTYSRSDQEARSEGKPDPGGADQLAAWLCQGLGFAKAFINQARAGDRLPR